MPQTELYRNATHDELFFIHRGSGRLETMFGVLPFRPFDYVVIPRCTTYRIDFDAETPPDLLVIEAAGNIAIPPRYLNPDGQLRLGAPTTSAICTARRKRWSSTARRTRRSSSRTAAG